MSYKPSNPNGQKTMANSEPVVIASDQSAIPVTGPLTDTQLRNTAVPVSLASVPSHAVTLASTTITGTVAVTDNAGSITVDAPVGAPAFVRLSDGAAAITTLPVSLASVPSHPVTNAGTFAVQVTSAPTTAVTGTFWQATQPVSGTVEIGATSLSALETTNAVQSGTWTVQPGNTANTTPWLTKINDGTNSATVKAASAAAVATDPALVVAVSPNNSVAVTQAVAANLNATVTGTVELGATSLAALENISVTIPGTVDLGTVSLSALETITVTQTTPANFQSKSYGAVTTAAPTYTTGTDNSLSLTTNGALRVDVMSALPAGTNAIGKLSANDGVDIGDVTINNASLPVTGTFWQATQPVSLASVPSHPVTNAGTFAVQAAQSGAWNINSITTLPTLPAGDNNIGNVDIVSMPTVSITANSSVNMAQIAGVATTTGNGISGTGVQRVTLASDSTGQVTLAAGAAAIGTVEIGATSLAALETINAAQSGTWNIGTVTTVTTANLAADDVHDGIAGTTLVMTGGYASATAPTAVVAGDAARVWTTLNGAVNIADGGSTISIDDGAGSITVDGTFWQATQPVSIASMPSTPVTGTFWQATQPVSLASVPSHAVTNAGTFAVQAAQSGTWTVQPGNTANTTPWLVKTNESLGTATALGALNAEIIQALNGNLGSAATVTATSAPTGIVLTPYASYDGGTNWTVTQFFNSNIGDVVDTLTSFTVGAAYSISAGDGATHVKVRATSWTSGSVTVRVSSTNSQGLVNLKATASHDSPAGNFVIQGGAYASSTAPTAVANGDVVRLWATTAGALNIADGGTTISIDDGAGSITVDGTFWQATQPVSLASVPSHPVTNAGTFAVQATLAAETTKVIGTVNIAAAQTLATVTTVGAVTSITNALPAGTNAIGKLAANSGVDIGDVDVLSVIPGTGATNLGKQTDSAAGATDTGVAILAIRDDALTTLTPVDGDYTRFRVNSVGRLWTSATIDAALPAGTNAIGSITNTSFAATQSGTWNINAIQSLPTLANVTTVGTVTNLSQLGGTAISMNTGVRDAGTQRVTIATNDSVPVTGTFWQTTQPVSGTVASTQSGTWNIGSITTLPTLANVTTVGTVTTITTANLAADDVHDGVAGTTAVMMGGYAYGVGIADNALPAVSANADAARFITNKNGAQVVVHLPEATQAYAPTNATTTAYATSLVVKASAGTLYMITGYNSKTSAQFIQVYDSATLPANGAVPKVIFIVPPESNFSYDLGNYGRYFAAGITIGNSSTGPTKTIGAADCWFDVQYK